MSDPLRVCVVGVGAIGGLVAAWLGRLPPSRLRLSALARGAARAALRREGLVLHDAQGTHRLPLQAADDPAALGEQDLVILAVKAPALAVVAPAVARLLAPAGRVLVAMNGVPWWFFDGLAGAVGGPSLESVDPGGAILRALPASRVIGGVVHLSSRLEAPACVRHIQGRGLIIGEPDGSGSHDVQATAELLSQAGFEVTVSGRIQRDIWFKLWGNMTMNPVSALTGAAADRILDDELVRGFLSAAMLEAQAIGARIGCAIDQTPDERHAVTRKLGAFKTSMLQDAEAGRAIELDALVAAVREIGARLAIATPNIDALFGLTRLMARTRGLYPG